MSCVRRVVDSATTMSAAQLFEGLKNPARRSCNPHQTVVFGAGAEWSCSVWNVRGSVSPAPPVFFANHIHLEWYHSISMRLDCLPLQMVACASASQSIQMRLDCLPSELVARYSPESPLNCNASWPAIASINSALRAANTFVVGVFFIVSGFALQFSRPC